MLRVIPCAWLAACLLLARPNVGAHEPASSRADSRAFGAIMPRLSSNGETIAFSYQGAIWRMPREGGEMTRLTRGAGFDVEPAWSPDGARLAFISGPNFGSGNLR
jgi:Tol biopolymer transport system component